MVRTDEVAGELSDVGSDAPAQPARRLPALAPTRPATEEATVPAVCAYWGEEACRRPSTFVIYGPKAPIASCDMHVGQQVGWQVYLARRDGVMIEEILVRARAEARPPQ